MDRIQVDTSRLSHVTGADVCIVMTKRVNINGKVRPYNKYFCNSSAAANTAYETWSSSKVFAAANAGGNMRKGSPTCSSGRFGLDAKVWGKNGYTQLADLVTAVVAYDETAGYSSNGLSAYFHDIGGRDSMNSLVKERVLVVFKLQQVHFIDPLKVSVAWAVPKFVGWELWRVSPFVSDYYFHLQKKGEY